MLFTRRNILLLYRKSDTPNPAALSELRPEAESAASVCACAVIARLISPEMLFKKSPEFVYLHGKSGSLRRLSIADSERH